MQKFITGVHKYIQGSGGSAETAANYIHHKGKGFEKTNNSHMTGICVNLQTVMLANLFSFLNSGLSPTSFGLSSPLSRA